MRNGLRQAWLDSQAGLTGGHEEGGFVLSDAAAKINIVRWPRGEQDRIVMPPHAECRLGDTNIIATFHTHPNTGRDYLQEPGESDRLAVRDDPDLKGPAYIGEFVISRDIIYLIEPTGRVVEVGATDEILGEE